MPLTLTPRNGRPQTPDQRHTEIPLASRASGTSVEDHLGHGSIRTTSDRYGHLYDAARDRLRDRLDETYSTAVNGHGNPA